MDEKLTSCCSYVEGDEQMSRQGGRVPASCPPGFQGRYTVQPGDTMFFIAQRFGVSLQALINANPHITNPNLIFPGDVLCVPGPPPAQDCRIPASCPPGFQGRYTVQPGDTMFFIAQRFGVSLQALINANPHITNPNLIFPCDVLCVPGPAPQCRIPASCPPGFQGRYTVQPGDTMFFIAQRFGVSLQALINANPHITNPAEIFPCDVLCVPGPAAPQCRIPASCPPGFQGRYTVQPGDTMFFIAQRFGVSLQALINANPHITNPAEIFPCDVLCVPGPTAPQCRIPASCPPGFQGRYTVQPGDTMFFIAQRFGVTLQALINANPHITNPNEIFPCDVLCVPGHKPPPPPPPPKKLDLPCCLLLTLIKKIPGSDALGVAMVQNLVTNRQAVSVLVGRAPLPSQLGPFNAWEVVIEVPSDGTFRFLLKQVQDNPTLFAGTIELKPGTLTRDTRIRVRPINTKFDKAGDAVLSGVLKDCCN